MKLRDHYDWVVIGDHPAALMSAALAAKRGFSVLILPLGPVGPLGEQKTLWTDSKGAFLDLEPNLIVGLGPALGGPGPLLRCLERLGLSPQDKSLFRAESESIQVLTTEARLLLGTGLEAFGWQLAREFTEQALGQLGLATAGARLEAGLESAVERLWLIEVDGVGAIPSERGKGEILKGGWERRFAERLRREMPVLSSELGPWGKPGQPAKDWLGSRGGHPGLAQVLQGAMMLLSGSGASGGFELFEALCLLGLARTGVSVQGGLGSLRAMLRRLAVRNGADAPTDTICSRIFLNRGSFVGVLPTRYGEMIGAKGAILGRPSETLTGIFSPELSEAAAARAIGWRFSVAVTVPVSMLPPGMTRRMVWQEPGGPTLEIELAAPEEYLSVPARRGPAPESAVPQVNVFLRSVLPLTLESLETAQLRLTAARMLRKLAQVAPFLDQHIMRVYPDFRPDPCPELREIYGFDSVSAIPGVLRVFAGPGRADEGLGTGMRGLFAGAGETCPELGAPGWLLTASEAISWLAGTPALRR